MKIGTTNAEYFPPLLSDSQDVPNPLQMEKEGSPTIGLLSTSEEEKLLKTEKSNRVFNRILGGGLFLFTLAGVCASSFYLREVFQDYIRTCAEELNTFSPSLTICREPFKDRILFFELILVVSSFALCYLLQRSWEYKKEEKVGELKDYVSSPIERESTGQKVLNKVRYSIAYLQSSYGYELSLGLGYLYNGLWIVPNSQSSWSSYFVCQAASLGLGGGFLGMYIRLQQLNLSEIFRKKKQPEQPLQIRQFSRSLVLGGVGSTAFLVSFLPFLPIPAFPRELIREVGLMLIFRPVGEVVAASLKAKQASTPLSSKKGRVISWLSTALHLHSYVVIASYCLYLNVDRIEAHLATTALIGFALGIKDRIFEKMIESPQIEKNNQKIIYKIGRVSKKYLPPILLAGIAVASPLIPQLKCESIKMYVCPISFELSGNYINIDGSGLSYTVGTGLATFYARKFFRFIGNKRNGCINTGASNLLQFLDRYQFDLVAAIPYAIFKSGVYIPPYNAFASYDPLAVLILLGVTLGAYREQISARGSLQFKPAFVNLGLLTNPL